METIKVGIIGCGGIANQKHMPSLKGLGDVAMVGFCDLIRERAEKAVEEFGAPGAVVYDTAEELLANKEITVVHVLVPNCDHAPLTIAALEAGKHVMCEKPMATNSKEAKAMVEAAKRTGKKLTIGYQNRFRPDSLYLKKACEEGELGHIYYGRAHAIRRRAVPTWGVFLDEEKQGGGPLIDIGTHALDLSLWMMDNYEPDMVVGTTYHELGKRENAANAWGPWDPKLFTVEDSAFGFIRFKNGATLYLEASWALNSLFVHEAKTSLCGTEGGADMLDGLRINGERYGKMYVTRPELEARGADFYDGKSITPADLEARMWIDHVKGKGELLVKPEQAFVVTQILEAIYESAQTGKPVYL